MSIGDDDMLIDNFDFGIDDELDIICKVVFFSPYRI